MEDLPIIQKTYDFVKWYVPILNKLPRDHKFLLGNRIVSNLYNLLERLIRARFARDKLPLLESLNSELDLLRYQTRLLLDFQLISVRRYEYASEKMHDIGSHLGGWLKQQQRKSVSSQPEAMERA